MSPESIALNRFGLGYAPGDDPAGDPRGWLTSQISRFAPIPYEDAALFPSASDLARRMDDLNNLRRNRNKRISEAGAGDGMEVRSDIAKQAAAMHVDYEILGAARMDWAARSREPFMERMAHFWANHFAVDVSKRILRSFAGAHELVAVRPFIDGSFADLLRHASLSPAMLQYLDQTRSVGPNSRAAERNRSVGRRESGLNENLAREILELHTLGVGGSYTQADVLEFARVLTGWNVASSEHVTAEDGWPAGSAFQERVHEPGSRKIMGRNFMEGGPEQTFAILDFLAVHPSTARHIATKLSRHFSGDEPAPAMVDRIAEAFLSSQGDLPTVYRAIIASPEAWQDEPVKFRQPIEWLAGAMRAAGGFDLPARRIVNLTRELGQQLWAPGSPAGYPDTETAWLAPDALVRRAEAASVLSDRAEFSDVRELADVMFPGSLSRSTHDTLRAAASNSMAFGLLMLSPEMLRR